MLAASSSRSARAGVSSNSRSTSRSTASRVAIARAAPGALAAPAERRRAAAAAAASGISRRPSFRRHAIEEKRDTTNEAAAAPDVERLAALRRADGAPEPKQSDGGSGGRGDNLLQGAVSEAKLITWPRPGKALLDTALVLGIVAGTSALVFGLNVALAELAGAWYKSH